MELKVQNVFKNFGEKEVLRDISLLAQSGTALGLLGRNGAGKTTTIRIIMGVFLADKGKVLIDGKPINRDKIRIGYMPEERGLYPKIKICDQMAYLAQLRGMTSKDAQKACDQWLERMGMTEYKTKKLETLSKGNQQKIQLAVTLMCNPQIVILDEPFSGLDPVNAMLLKDVIKEMIDGGAIVLFSSHQMNYIEEFCESIAIINQGKIAIDGKISEIKHSYPRDRIAVTSSKDYVAIGEFALKNMSDITEMEYDGEDTLIFKMKSPDCKNRLFAELSQKNFDIDCFKVCEPSLNDIFVEYTEGGI